MSRTWVGAVAGSALLVVGVLVRSYLAHAWPWLVYNLALAWVPVVLGAVVARWPDRGWWLAPAWFAFLPNAPYLLTDLVHLSPRSPVPFWFDAALLGGAGALGLWLGAASLAQVAEVLEERVGRAAAWCLRLSAPVACGFGMYLGRFLRWNSWDLVVRPDDVLRDALAPLLAPSAHADAWAFTATFGASFLCAVLVVRLPARPAVR
ncbi:MAG: DUF1361 domain-containing protein [Alphaproteobacteria bacterium]|nr:DUF1361 domain-containing protein [Alphaproteobacteria bacterium]MCB9700023.1 DUF1361 domain-containing protein [Alphaproteobacteria bacterium]